MQRRYLGNEKDTGLPVHRGAAAVIDGTERTFLDKYGDYFWFALLLLSGIGSAGAWLRHYFNRDERQENTNHRARILAMVSKVRTAEADQELLAMQREVDAIISETLECCDDGAIEEEELAAFGLVLELFNHAVVERRAALRADTSNRLAARREATASRLNDDVAPCRQRVGSSREEFPLSAPAYPENVRSSE